MTSHQHKLTIKNINAIMNLFKRGMYTMSQNKVALQCEVCGSRNYTTSVGNNHDNRLEVKKYCKHCGKATMHKETR